MLRMRSPMLRMRSPMRFIFHFNSSLVMTPLLVTSLLFSPNCWSRGQKSQPNLTVKVSGKLLSFKRSQLLARPDLITLEVEKVPAYEGKKMTFQAIPIYSLFKGVEVSPDAILQYRCLDGFSAAISQERLFNSSSEKSVAYLAIEPEKKWPKMKAHGVEVSPGPFYIVWSKPEVSQINQEEWPYQVTGFEVKKSLKESYPDIFPAASLKEDAPERKGFKVFTQVCFNCHTMNLQGGSQVGPDLNYPMSPTEYFKDGILQSFVRNPGSIRKFLNEGMPAFSAEVVSDLELENLVLYLKHMSGRKVKPELSSH
jgi:mono/diheme cytochrome c family protein